MAESATRQGGGGELSFSIKNKSTLYAVYMPYVINGGIFIPTKRNYKMGEEVLVSLNLMEETEPLSVTGKIIWKTPAGSEGHRLVGIGVQFSGQDKGATRNKIETYLAGSLEKENPTYTM